MRAAIVFEMQPVRLWERSVGRRYQYLGKGLSSSGKLS